MMMVEHGGDEFLTKESYHIYIFCNYMSNNVYIML